MFFGAGRNTMHNVRIPYKNTGEYRMETKEKYTISEATELLGFKSRSTLNKKTKTSGTDSISFEHDENGTKVIPLVELQRVFPDRIKIALSKQSDTKNTFTGHSTKAHSNTTKNTVHTGLLEQKLESLEAQLERERSERQRERQESKDREQKADEREEHLRDQVSDLTKNISQHTRLLEYHQTSSPEAEAIEKEKPGNKFRQTISEELVKVLKVAALIIVLFAAAIFFFQ